MIENWQDVLGVQASGSVNATASTGWILQARPPTDQIAPTGLQLAAKWVRIEVYTSHTEHAAPVAVDGVTTTYSSRVVYEGPANITAVSHASDYYFFTAAARGDLRWGASSFSAKAPGQSPQSYPPSPASNAAGKESYPVNGTAEFVDPAGTLDLRGGFELDVYRIDLLVQAPNGTWTVRTGTSTNAPTAIPYGLGYSVDEREARVAVQGGTLRFNLPGGPGSLYVRGAKVAVNGTVTFQQTQADPTASPQEQKFDAGAYALGLDSVPSPNPLGPVRNATLGLPGGVANTFDYASQLRARLDALRAAGPLPPAGSVAVPADPEQDSGEGALPGIATVAALPSAPWVAAATAVAVLALVAVLVLRPGFRWRRLEQAMDLGLYDQVLQKGKPFLQRGRHQREAAVLMSMALLKAKGGKPAEDFLGLLGADKRPDAGTWNYLMAWAKARQGLLDEARELVRACLEVEPAYTGEIRRNPVLASLLSPRERPGPEQGYE